MASQVIILNGVSSAGKTTLAKAIQKYAGDIWMHIAMDSFMTMLPDGREFDREWFPVTEVAHEDGTLPRISNGPSGEALLSQMRQLVARMAESGFNVIVDEVADRITIEDYRRRLGSACLVVKVDAPLSELERRERERGDRLIGLAREQSARIHEGIEYDLEVNTLAQTPDALARSVLEAALA
ncbi:MAG: AAA family ATPase [Pseudomonadota bacterium]